MTVRAFSFEKFVGVSALFHLAVVAVLYVGVPKPVIYTPIEISFGPIKSAALPGPVTALKPSVPVKPKAVNTPKALAETPVVESKVADAVTTAASSVAPSSTAESASGGGGNGVGTGLGGSGSMDPRALYTGRILQLVQSQVEYPRSAKVLGREGTVLVEVKVARDGSILSTKIKKKADFDAFNKNALETFKRVGKFEPVPAEFGREELTVLLPVKYFIRNL